MAFLPDGRILFVERRGPVKMVKPGDSRPVNAWNRKVFWEKSLRNQKIEDGTLGIAVDPGFAANKWIYLYYSPLAPSVNRLSRFTLNGDQIDTASEKVLLDVEVQRDYCCHTGGGMGFDAAGNLYLTTGDNTASDDAYAAINERPDMVHRDAQRTSGNTDDLRGKLIRIKPSPDGRYTIPAGNLKEAFAHLWPTQALEDKVRPEIYSMGHRNPYTLWVDRYTGWAHIAEVGPDARTFSADKGPAQHEEFNLVRKAGNFGWPYFMGDNQAYRDWDYVANTTGPAFNPQAVVNNSVNNTGVNNLPPAEPPIASREYGKAGKTTDGAAKFPAFMGTTALTGPIYYYDGRIANAYKLPPHFDRKWLMTDHGTGIINIATLDARGESVTELVRSVIDVPLDRPVALEVGPDGGLYVIEYAAGNFQFTNSTKISRIEYTGNCRPATPVPPEIPTALATRNAARPRLMARVEGGQAVRLPAGVPGFSLHDLRGAKVWEYRGAASDAESRVALPADLPQGVLQVRLHLP
jgi:cytochrome c